MDIKKFGFYFLFLIIFLISLKFYSIVYDFFPSIAAACVFAYLFNPLYCWLKKKTKHEHISAFIIIGIVVFLIMIPLILIIFGIQQQMQMLFREDTVSNAKATFTTVIVFFEDKFNIELTNRIQELFVKDSLPRVFSGVQGTVAYLGPRMIMNITKFILYTFIALFTMYYILTNSSSVVRTFRDYFPISLKNSDILLKQMGHDTKALIYGQLLIATMQGTLGAIGFFIFGVSGALFWGMIMIMLSFLPLLGSSLVWFPAALMLLAKGRYIAALGMFFWGVLMVGTSDNIVRPKLTGALGKMHPVTVLLGVFIGIKEWGAIGIVLGPLMISVLINLIRMFREEYITE